VCSSDLKPAPVAEAAPAVAADTAPAAADAKPETNEE